VLLSCSSPCSKGNVTCIPILCRPFVKKSLKRARKVTTAFHNIHRQLENISAHGSKVHKNFSFVKQTDGVQLRRELDDLGGRQAYQEASVLTTTRHRTCKWVFAMITRLGLRPGKQSPPLRLLEVGAVNTQLMSVPWLAVRAIDIQESRLRRWSFLYCLPNIVHSFRCCRLSTQK